MPFFFDSTIILILPAFIFALWAQSKVQGTYKKYSRVYSSSGLTGAKVARRILDRFGLNDVPVEATSGVLSDHYDPTKRKVRLSEGNYGSTSLAAIAVAAHEVGHAIQHKEGYAALKFRHAMVAPLQIGSFMAWPLLIAGFIFASPSLIDIGIVLFSLTVVFHLVTLPVELDASRRAIQILNTDGYVMPQEASHAKKVLSAAAWTYVAAAAMAILQLLRLFVLRGMMDD